jgi:hypothetical protein
MDGNQNFTKPMANGSVKSVKPKDQQQNAEMTRKNLFGGHVPRILLDYAFILALLAMFVPVGYWLPISGGFFLWRMAWSEMGHRCFQTIPRDIRFSFLFIDGIFEKIIFIKKSFFGFQKVPNFPHFFSGLLVLFRVSWAVFWRFHENRPLSHHFLKVVRKFPQKECVVEIESGRRMTFQEFNQHANKYANLFKVWLESY